MGYHISRTAHHCPGYHTTVNVTTIAGAREAMSQHATQAGAIDFGQLQPQ